MSTTYRDSPWDRQGVIDTILRKVAFPHMAQVRQRFDNASLQDIPAAIFTCVGIDKRHPRIVRIENTSHLSTIRISAALRREALDRPDIDILEPFRPLPFNSNGDLLLEG
jgi:hypothetical protein